MLIEFRGKEIKASVGSISTMCLKEGKSALEGAPGNALGQNGVDDASSLGGRSDECSGAVLGSRAKSATARFHRKEGLSPRRPIQLTAEEERKGGEL